MAEKILIIDDHQETINLVSVILKRQGYRLYTARSGREGLTLARQEDPDLILLDVMMPDLDGLEVCRRLRTLDQFADTPIIMFTAKSMADEKWAGFQAGATDYLVKPTNTEELTRRVRAVLNRSVKKGGQPPPTSSGEADKTEEAGRFRPQTVAFIGARGGAGSSTAAINTAFIFSRRYATLLVDLDMVQGHIAQYLNIEFKRGLNNLIAGGTIAMRGQLSNEVHVHDEQLHLLLSQPNHTGDALMAEPKHIPHLFDALSHSGRQVLIDAGSGISSVNQPLLERVDHVVICLKPERVSVSGARSLLKRLEEIALPTTSIHLLLFDLGPTPQIPQQALEKYLGQKFLTLIQVSDQQMSQASDRGRPLVDLYPQTKIIKSFALVAKSLVEV